MSILNDIFATTNNIFSVYFLMAHNDFDSDSFGFALKMYDKQNITLERWHKNVFYDILRNENTKFEY